MVEPAFWTRVHTPGVEPTNNAAERALRPAVIWRSTSAWNQSEAGSQFVARMLSVNTSLKAQGRSVLEFLAQGKSGGTSGYSWSFLAPSASTPAIYNSFPPNPHCCVMPGTVTMYLIQVERKEEPTGRTPRLLWLVWVGEEMPELSTIWRHYLRRFAVDHWYRFAKQRLHWTLPKLSTPEQCERWSDLMPL